MADAQQADAREADAQEGDAQEGDAQQADAQEGDAQEADAQGGDAREADAQGGDAREADARRSDAQEGDAQQAESEAVPPRGERPPRSPFQSVLCGVDGTKPSFAAVAQAAAIAGGGGRLTLLAVTAATGSGRFRAAAIGSIRVKRLLDRAARLAEEAGVACETAVDPGGPPSDVLVARAAEHELLALGAPARSGLGAFGGGVAVSALHTFITPLLLARPLPDGGSPTERIVIATDGSDGSDRLVGLAARLVAAAHSESVTLVHAQGAETRAQPHRIQAQQRALREAIGRDVALVVEPGDACETILRAARTADANLVVIGSRRLSGIGAALGSVSRRVVHSLECSVLVVPPQQLADRSPDDEVSRVASR